MHRNRHHLMPLLVVVGCLTMGVPALAFAADPGTEVPSVATERVEAAEPAEATTPSFSGVTAVAVPVGMGDGSVSVTDPRFGVFARNAAGARMSVTPSVDAVSTVAPGIATVYYTATDEAGNTAETSVTFTVSDEVGMVVVRRAVAVRPGAPTLQTAGVMVADGGVDVRLVSPAGECDVRALLVDADAARTIDARGGFATSGDELAAWDGAAILGTDWTTLTTDDDGTGTFVPVIAATASEGLEATDVTVELRYDASAPALGGGAETPDRNDTDGPTADAPSLSDLLMSAIEPAPLADAGGQDIADGTQAVFGNRVMTVYGATDASVSAVAVAGNASAATGVITYAVAPGSEELVDVDALTGALTIKRAGTAHITATAGQTVRYPAASTNIVVSIAKAPQTIDVSPTMRLELGEMTTAGASLATGEGELAYTVMDGDDVVSVDATTGEVRALAVGTATIAVSASSTDNYLSAAVPLTAMVAKEQQVIIVAPTMSVTYGGAAARIGATRPIGDGALSYALADGGDDVLEVNASTGELTPLKAGNATVVVAAAETSTYNAASTEVKVTVRRGVQTITAPTSVSVGVGGTTPVTATATGSATAEAGAVSLEMTSGTDKATYVAGVVRGLVAGNATLTVRAAQTDHYNAASAVVPVSVNRAVQTVSATTPVALTCGGADGAVSITGHTGDGTLSYALAAGSQSGVVEVDGTTGTLHALKAGTATVVVSAAETSTYAAATTEVTVNVSKGTPTLSFAQASVAKHPGDAAFTNALTTTPAGLQVSYTSSDASVATVIATSGLVTPAIVGSGTTTITANFAGDDSYEGASASYTLTLTSKPSQTIAVDAESLTFAAGGAPRGVGARVTVGDGALSYATSDASVATVSDAGIVTPVSAGTATITVTAAETAAYAQATKAVAVTVASATQSFDVPSSVDMTYGQEGVAIAVTNRTPNGGAISFALAPGSANDGVVSVDGSTGALVAHKAGSATVAVTAAATGSYAALTKNVTVNVARATRTLVVPETLELVCGTTGSAAATELTDGGTVTYAVTTGAGVVGVDAQTGVVTALAAGSATITATAPQTDCYLAATATTQVSVSRATQAITANDVSVTYGDEGARVQAIRTPDDGGTLSYAVSANTDVISVDATTGTLTIKKAGSATVTVTAAETARYTEAVRSITVTVAPKSITNAAVVIPEMSYVFDGTAHTPDVSVVLGAPGTGTTLVANTDYTLSYANNVCAGVATVTATGIGNYTGEALGTFGIVAGERNASAVVLDGAPVAGAMLDTSIDALIGTDERPSDYTGLFDAAERSLIDDGASVRVWLSVANANVDAVAFARSNATLLQVQLGSTPTIAIFADIDLMKSVNGAEPTAVAEPGGGVRVTLTLPDSVIPSDATARTWRVFREHNGEVTALDAAYDASKKTITFVSDSFSAFGVGYGGAVTAPSDASSSATANTTSGSGSGASTSPKTGDIPWLSVAASLAFVGLVVGAAGVFMRRRG